MTTTASTKYRLIERKVETQAGLSSRNLYMLRSRRGRTGVPNPKWRTQIRAGGNASTTFTGYEYLTKYEDGVAQVSYWVPHVNDPNRKVNFVRVSNETAGSAAEIGYINPDYSKADNQALIRAYKAVREAQYQISGPMFLAELRETIQMLKRPAGALRNYLQSYVNALNKRKGRVPRQSFPRVVADTWLEYSFGVAPFLGDVKSAAETLARFNTDYRRALAKAYGENSVVYYAGLLNAAPGALVPYLQYTDYDVTAKVVYRIGINAKMGYDEGSTRRLIELSGFQMQNFIPTVWEVLPWSFLTDYFTNVGNVIEAGCTDTSNVTRVTKNRIGETRIAVTTIGDPKAAKATYGGNFISCDSSSLGNWQALSRQVSRESSALAYPTLEFKLPGSKTQLGNLAALYLTGRRVQG